ncbi:hypothetical protein DPMN_177586 [Dreissena polymorpha]|uniref:Uncharacterized protein n=1 Tax=Dreissena polymorpha TaxID=45954 RepID=A0A9D4EBE3_DREPO|nr:hypothetical protein DPMN_177586 [Dreissena polymorpha]
MLKARKGGFAPPSPPTASAAPLSQTIATEASPTSRVAPTATAKFPSSPDDSEDDCSEAAPKNLAAHMEHKVTIEHKNTSSVMHISFDLDTCTFDIFHYIFFFYFRSKGNRQPVLPLQVSRHT